MADNAHQTGGTIRYSGPGFSLLGDKSRFVLPPKFRKMLKDSNGGSKTLYIDKHPFFPCLIGFGEPYQAMLEAEVGSDSADARTRAMRQMQFFAFDDVPFDDSGRFVMPRHMMDLVGISDAVYFHGNGPMFSMWDPQTLLGLDGEHLVTAQAHCASLLAASKARK